MVLALENLNLLFFLLLNREEIRHTESCNVPNGQIVEQYSLPNKSDIRTNKARIIADPVNTPSKAGIN